MASASFSSDALSEEIQKQKRDKAAKKIRKRKENGWEEVHREMESRELSKAIQNLPPDVRERIQKGFIEIIINEKKEMGWMDIHEEIENLPYCEIQGQLTKVFLCTKCNNCDVTGKCVACHENEKKWHTLVDREEVWEQEEKGFARIWGTPKLISESPKGRGHQDDNVAKIG